MRTAIVGIDGVRDDRWAPPNCGSPADEGTAVTGDSVLRLREIALDADAGDESRFAAIDALAKLQTPGAVDALLELGSRSNEADEILRAAGNALAVLDDRLVSQWDVRNLADPAADAFYE